MTILDALSAKRGFLLEHERIETSRVAPSSKGLVSRLMAAEPLEPAEQAALFGRLVDAQLDVVVHMLTRDCEAANALSSSIGQESFIQLLEAADQAPLRELAPHAARHWIANTLAELGYEGRKPIRNTLAKLREAVEKGDVTDPTTLDLLDGGDRIRATLVEHNTRIVSWVMGRYAPLALKNPHGVLTGIGGLIDAIDAFEPTQGSSLITYAKYWIRARVGRWFQENQPLRTPAHIPKRRAELHRLRDEAIDAGDVTARTRADRQLAVMRAQLARIRNPWTTSFEGENTAVYNLVDETRLTPQRRHDLQNLSALVVDVVGTLEDRHRDIIRRRFPLDGSSADTLQEIGDDYDVSRERIRQLEAIALKRLRKLLGVSTLQALLSAPEAALTATATSSTSPSSVS